MDALIAILKARAGEVSTKYGFVVLALGAVGIGITEPQIQTIVQGLTAALGTLMMVLPERRG